jgi:hypothetical protein
MKGHSLQTTLTHNTSEVSSEVFTKGSVPDREAKIANFSSNDFIETTQGYGNELAALVDRHLQTRSGLLNLENVECLRVVSFRSYSY